MVDASEDRATLDTVEDGAPSLDLLAALAAYKFVHKSRLEELPPATLAALSLLSSKDELPESLLESALES